jgi:hypothetical protein
MLHVLEEYREPALYLDSDILVRGGLDEVFGSLDYCDLIVLHRPQLEHVGIAGTPHASKFNSGVIAVTSREAGVRFARRYRDLLDAFIGVGAPALEYKEDYGVNVALDQELLYVTYLEMRNALSFSPLPVRFNDSRFRLASAIWHGKGAARRHPAYVIERLRYRHPFLFHPMGCATALLYVLRRCRLRLLGRGSSLGG